MFIAERQGFEPRVPRSTTVFKTAAIDHSATSPKTSFSRSAFLLKRCKGNTFFFNRQINPEQNNSGIIKNKIIL